MVALLYGKLFVILQFIIRCMVPIYKIEKQATK